MAALPAAIHAFCVTRGLDAERLARWGVPREGYPDPDAFVPYAPALALWDALMSAFPNEPVGLQFGEFLGRLDVGVVGLATAHAHDLGAAIRCFIRLQHVVDPHSDVQVELSAASATVIVRQDPRLVVRRHPVEAALVSSHRTAERLAGTRLRAQRVEFAHAPLAGESAYRAVFQALPQQSGRFAITYERSTLDLPVQHARPELAKYLLQQAEAIGHKRPVSAQSTVERVLCWVRGQLSAGTLHESEHAPHAADVGSWTRSASEGASTQAIMGRAARALGMSGRTLQRQLAAEQTNFRQLLDGAYRDRAELLLTRSGLTVFEIAFLLGYTEPRSFHRAFKRWTGSTPSEHRARHSLQTVGMAQSDP